MTMTTLRHPSIIREHDRQTALTNGSLIDLTDEARRLRFRHAVAVTREVWDDCIWWDETIEEGKTGYSAQETQARLRDVLWHALLAAKRARGSRTYFTLDRVPTTGKGTQARSVTLALTIGPGDDFQPVLTIAFPEED